MPEQPTIIIQNANQQNNNGCGTGCGSGCGVLILAAILLWPISMVGQAMDGEAASWWIPVGLFLTLVEILLIGGVAFAWLDQKFGWGYMDRARESGRPPSSGTIPAEDLAGDASNYGAHGNRPDQPSAEAREKLARPVPHPDDPPKPRRPVGPIRGIDQRVDVPKNGPESEPQRPRSDDVYEQVRGLAKLRDEGHITQEEFEAKKRELLDRM